MPSRLIINADDFGLTTGINRAVAELHRAGVLTSATLMANGDAFDDAVTLALRLPHLRVGCHIVLVDGKPVSSPQAIPSLLAPDGVHFRTSLGTFVRDLYLGRIDPAEIAREAAAQIEKLRLAGVMITHVDTHKHTHIFPKVAGALLGLREVGALRNPFEPAFARAAVPGPRLRKVQLTLLNGFRPSFLNLAAKTATTDGTIGIAATGHLDADTLRRLLQALPQERTFELVCHPGYSDCELDGIATRLRKQRDIEREALLTEIPRMLALPDAPTLIHYGDL